MKVTTVQRNKLINPFPKIMISQSGRVVLFSSYKVGTQLSTGPTGYSGEHHSVWAMEDFTDLVGTVTLENFND